MNAPHALKSNQASCPSTVKRTDWQEWADGPLLSGRPDVRDARLLEFLEGWLSFRGGRLMPRRRDVQPMTFPRLLSMSYIYERIDDGKSFRCVLAGEEIHFAWGRPIQGSDVRDTFSAEDLPRVMQRWNRALDEPSMLFGRHILPGTHKSVERLLAPLSDDAGRPCFLIGVTVYRRAETEVDSATTPTPKAHFHNLTTLDA